MMSWRHALGAAGLLVAGAAVAAGHPVLVWVAIGLLVLSLGLRLFVAICKRLMPPPKDGMSAGEDG
jgi:hypothetical protein